LLIARINNKIKITISDKIDILQKSITDTYDTKKFTE